MTNPRPAPRLELSAAEWRLVVVIALSAIYTGALLTGAQGARAGAHVGGASAAPQRAEQKSKALRVRTRSS